MKKAISSAFVAIALGVFTFTGTARAQDSTPKTVVSDTFALTPSRTAGFSLSGTASETGNQQWAVEGKIVFRSDGGITVGESGAGATAVIGIADNDSSKPIRVSADINATGSGHTALAFVSTPSPGDYWKTVTLFMTMNPAGSLEIYSDKVTNKLFTGSASLYDFKANDYNHVELTYDPTAKTVSLSVNGKQVAKDVPVVTPPVISDIGLHFNEQTTANGPGIKNFAVTLLP